MANNITAVASIGELVVDLQDVDFEKFESKHVQDKISGETKKAYRISFELVTVIEDDLGYMRFRAEIHGRPVGEVRLRLAQD
jgi:hypothetical protein